MMWYLTVLLVIGQALGQAPGDYNPACRAGRNELRHIFPADWTILMDSFDYSSLIGNSAADPVWVQNDFDSNGFQWDESLGGSCTRSPRACSFQQLPQNNWLFTQYISYLNAKEVIFNISYIFSECQSRPDCNNDYVTLYHYQTNTANETGRRRTANYRPLLGSAMESRLQQQDRTSRVNLRLTLPTSNRPNGFYLGIQDDGTCGNLERIIVYFQVVRGRQGQLLTCPDVALPPLGSTSTSQETCTCAENASPASSTLNRVCDVNGMCNEDQDCACSPGFELVNGVCRACPEGRYRAGVSNSSCLLCPNNSMSTEEGSAVCMCVLPNIRDPTKPQDPCTAPPSSPRLLLSSDGIPQLTQSSVTLCWLPSLEAGGLDDLHYNVYLFSTEEGDPEFNKVNTEPLVQENGQNNICYELEDIDNSESYGVIIVSANGATGDPSTLMNLDEVQGHSITFFLSRGQAACNAAVPVVVTLFVTLIVVAVIIVLVILVYVFVLRKKAPFSSSVSHYNHASEKSQKPSTPSSSQSSTPSAPTRRPPPPGPARKPPPPRPPINK